MSSNTIPMCPRHGVPLTQRVTLDGGSYWFCGVCEGQSSMPTYQPDDRLAETNTMRGVYEQRLAEFLDRVEASEAKHIEDRVSDAIAADEFAATEGIVGLLLEHFDHAGIALSPSPEYRAIRPEPP